ncbi:hypothetical protein HID58_067269 [Brassica napus]|uniref:60S ribosomal protein L6 n=1 Tax=Brassica napus TaxID=3708 RepID=A0ABQ7ZI32_BRANA|nr:hypothetical protein HID58_067269 [Brassica napus]
MLCSNQPTRRLQLISNIFRREFKPPPPSSLMMRLTSSITPGTLLIILAGRFKGKRINDCHVLKVSDVSLDKYDDQYFGKVGEKKNKKGEGESLMEPLQSQALPCTSSLLSSSSACCLPLVSLLIHSNVSESSRQRER